MNPRLLLIISMFLVSQVILAQTKVISGRLITFNTYPVQNIQVKAKKSGAAVVTDSLGRFNIVCKDKDVLQIRPKAFQPFTVRVTKNTDSIVRNLVFIDNEENRKYATGYGYISENDLAYAVSHLDSENNDFCNYTDIFDLLVGRFPGVMVQSSGASKMVIIRGINSINLSSEALYVVDNIVTSDISYISPCQVQSIDVLKDGIASLYGARGANGVVVIELKK